MKLDPGSFAPIAVARRSDADESVHHGAGVVVDAQGRVAATIGDPDASVYLRSALKIFQTTALIELGLDLPDRLLALVAASHSGEQAHLDGVVEILGDHGLGVDDLANTPTLPYGEEARRDAVVARAAPASLFQNCSGKHAGMLATCAVNGWSVGDYLEFEHPLQRAVRERIEELGAPIDHVGVDGCGAPTFVVSLRLAADALRRLALGDAPALRAMRSHPEMVGGTGRDVTAWMRTVPGLVAKDGAAGVMAMVLTEGERRGWSAMWKIGDGSDAVRRAVVPAALSAMGTDVERVLASSDVWAGFGPEIAVLGGGRPVGAVDALPWSPVAPADG